VRRTNYIVTWSERHFGIALSPAVAPPLRAPLVALLCSLAFVLVVWSVQHARLRAAERDGVELARRYTTTARDVARVRAVEHDVTRLRALAERVANVRRSGTARASEIAVVGNTLPAGAWLTALHADRRAVAPGGPNALTLASNSALTLEGRSARLSTVGTAIAGLARLPSYGGARLISVHEDPARSGVTYAIALEQRR
jgi:Tfp pilus assembly protein PilN